MSIKQHGIIMTDTSYDKFIMKNPNILEEVVEILKNTQSGISLNKLATILNNNRYNCKDYYYIYKIQLATLLTIWEKNWCTFYGLGRIMYNDFDNKWHYIPKSHPNSRKRVLRVNVYV